MYRYSQIFLFAIDSHFAGPVNIQRILEITPGNGVSDLYTQVILIVSYSSQPNARTRAWLLERFLSMLFNNSKNYFQEHSPFLNSLFSFPLNRASRVKRSIRRSLETRRRGEATLRIRIGRKEGKKELTDRGKNL